MNIECLNAFMLGQRLRPGLIGLGNGVPFIHDQRSQTLTINYDDGSLYYSFDESMMEATFQEA